LKVWVGGAVDEQNEQSRGKPAQYTSWQYFAAFSEFSTSFDPQGAMILKIGFSRW